MLDTRSIMGPTALLQKVFYLVNLLGSEDQYSQDHLIIVEIVPCDVFLESQEKRSHEGSILKEASKSSSPATEYHC